MLGLESVHYKSWGSAVICAQRGSTALSVSPVIYGQIVSISRCTLCIKRFNSFVTLFSSLILLLLTKRKYCNSNNIFEVEFPLETHLFRFSNFSARIGVQLTIKFEKYPTWRTILFQMGIEIKRFILLLWLPNGNEVMRISINSRSSSRSTVLYTGVHQCLMQVLTSQL